MSNNKPVMSHDPLSGLIDDLADEDPAAIEAGPQSGRDKDSAAPAASSNDITVALPASLTIADVAELRSTLLSAVEGAEALSLQGSEIEQVDGAGLQLLAALLKEAERRDVVVTWIATAERLIEAAEQVGMTSAIGLAPRVAT